jgi:hypothetical protein
MLFQQRICQDVAGLLLVNNALVLEFHHYFPNTGRCQIDAFMKRFISPLSASLSVPYVAIV